MLNAVGQPTRSTGRRRANSARRAGSEPGVGGSICSALVAGGAGELQGRSALCKEA